MKTIELSNGKEAILTNGSIVARRSGDSLAFTKSDIKAMLAMFDEPKPEPKTEIISKQNHYWCCTADFGEHTKKCVNYQNSRRRT